MIWQQEAGRFRPGEVCDALGPLPATFNDLVSKYHTLYHTFPPRCGRARHDLRSDARCLNLTLRHNVYADRLTHMPPVAG